MKRMATRGIRRDIELRAGGKRETWGEFCDRTGLRYPTTQQQEMFVCDEDEDDILD